MKTNKYLPLAFALMVESATSPVGFAGTFTNGSFEVVGGIQLTPGQLVSLPSGDTRLTGWTVGGTGAAISVINGTIPEVGLDFPAIDGANQLDFNGGGGAPGTWISQTFDTAIGAEYTVSFYVARQGNTNGTLALRAVVQPAFGAALVDVVATPPKHGYGAKQSFTFTAMSSTTTLQFGDVSAGDIANADLDLDAVTVVEVTQPPANVQVSPSNDDLWDVSLGNVVTGQSEMNACSTPGGEGPFDARDIFGGNFSRPCYIESQDAIFADGKPDGFVHYVEWATPSPVTIRSFNLWAVGGYPPDSSLREMGSFRLLAKSAGASAYDLVLYTFNPSHPYKFVDDTYGLLISTDIKPTTARQFRAEFVNRTVAGECCDGPRVIELDGFGAFIGPSVSIRYSEAEVSWTSVMGLSYQVEYREDLAGSNWTALGSPVVGDGTVIRMTDKITSGQVRRFFRVRAVE